jgi:hypothetical protein
MTLRAHEPKPLEHTSTGLGKAVLHEYVPRAPQNGYYDGSGGGGRSSARGARVQQDVGCLAH